jgi:ABC-2 type transport system permease protein
MNYPGCSTVRTWLTLRASSSLLVVVEVIGIELLMVVTMTAFGVFVASHIQRMEGFSVVMQLLLFPMLFLSGALFPLGGLPGWLTVLTRINPLTYAVAPLRSVVFAAQHMPPAAAAKFSSSVTLFDGTLSIATCVERWYVPAAPSAAGIAWRGAGDA